MGPPNGYVFLFNLVCCIVGVVADIRVINKIVTTCREDGWRPRHVLLMGNIVSCALAIVSHSFIQLVYFCWPVKNVCLVFVAIYRLPYVSFLFNVFLSLAERYVAGTRSAWHRKKLSKWHCVAWLAVLNGALAIAVKWLYVGRFESVECAFHFNHGLTLVGAALVLFFLCTVALIGVFIITWRQLPRAARAIPVPLPPPTASVISSEELHVSIRPQQQPINPAEIEYVLLRDLLPNVDQHSQVDVQPPTAAVESSTTAAATTTTQSSSNETLRQMELQVTKHFLFTIVPLFVTLVPCFIVWFFLLIRFYLIDPRDSATISAAVSLVSYLPYIGLLPTFHVIIYPIANMFLNKEMMSFCSFCSFPMNCVPCCHCQCSCPLLSKGDDATLKDDHKKDPNFLYH